VDRVGARQELGDDGVPGLVVGGVALLLLGEHGALALDAHEDLVLGVLEVEHLHLALAPARGEQGRLVDQVLQVGAGEAGGAAGDDLQVHLVRDGHLLAVDLEDLQAPLDVGPAHVDLPVEAAGAQEGGVEDVGPVGGGDQDHPLGGLEAVHLDEQLVQGLLALVVASP